MEAQPAAAAAAAAAADEDEVLSSDDEQPWRSDALRREIACSREAGRGSNRQQLLNRGRMRAALRPSAEHRWKSQRSLPGRRTGRQCSSSKPHRKERQGRTGGSRRLRNRAARQTVRRNLAAESAQAGGGDEGGSAGGDGAAAAAGGGG